VAVDAALAADPRLAPSVRAVPGIRIPGLVEPAEALARAVLGQQVSVRSARTTVQRLVERLGTPLALGAGTGSGGGDGPDGEPGPGAGGWPTRLFPTAATLAEHAAAVVGGPRARVAALVRACEAVATGELDLDVADTREDFVAGLRALPGIGPWTAELLALRYLRCSDVLLDGDAAVRAGARALGLGEGAAALRAAAAPLAPWRSYVTMHLWRAY